MNPRASTSSTTTVPKSNEAALFLGTSSNNFATDPYSAFRSMLNPKDSYFLIAIAVLIFILGVIFATRRVRRSKTGHSNSKI